MKKRQLYKEAPAPERKQSDVPKEEKPIAVGIDFGSAVTHPQKIVSWPQLVFQIRAPMHFFVPFATRRASRRTVACIRFVSLLACALPEGQKKIPQSTHAALFSFLPVLRRCARQEQRARGHCQRRRRAQDGELDFLHRNRALMRWTGAHGCCAQPEKHSLWRQAGAGEIL